jgi:ribosomal protein L23
MAKVNNTIQFFKQPLISEKASKTPLWGNTFLWLIIDANEFEIKKAVEKIYKVKVLKIKYRGCKGKN